MFDILSLLSVFKPHFSATTITQFCYAVFAPLAMTGEVTMLNISH